MKLTLKPKLKAEQYHKCYRCGYTSERILKFCPKCMEDSYQIRMMIQMED